MRSKTAVSELFVKTRAAKRLAVSRLVVAFALALACVSGAAAQQLSVSLHGRVTDARGAAIAGATVTLYARGGAAPRLSTTTDETGAYRFERLAPGIYLVEAEAEGFARGASDEVTVERGGASSSTSSGDITLQVADVSTEVVVTASDSPQRVDEVSKAVTVIGRQQLDERAEYSIPEALRTVPGLRVRQLGGPGSLTTIRTRGLRNEDTAVLVDGLRLRDPSAPQSDASSLIGDLNVADVSRVEVLRGSGSSLYGTNAVGGVVNVITDEGGGPFRGNLLAEGGSRGHFRGRAQVAGGAGEADRLAYSMGVSHLNVARGIDGDDAARNTSAQGRATLRLTPSVTLSGRGYFSDSFAQTNNNPFPVGAQAGDITDAVAPSGEELRRYEAGVPVSQLNLGGATFIPSTNNPDARQRGRFFSGALVFTHRLGEDASYAVSYQGLGVTRANINGAAGQRFDFEGSTHTVNARADLRLGRANHVTAGYEFEGEEFTTRLFFGDPALDSATGANERSHALFVQDQLRLLGDRLQLSAAFRAQFFRLDRPRFEPASTVFAGPFEAPPAAYTGDGSAAYLFRSTGTKLRAHVGNGYRAPSLFERFGASFFAGSFFPFGNPNLRPERSIAFDAGADQSLYDNRLRLSATYFYTRLQETIVFDFPYRNAGGGLARGAELSAEAAPTSTTDLFASYTYTNSDQRAPQAGGVIGTFTIPDHQASLVLTQRVGRRLAFNFDLAASGDYLAPVFDPATFATRVYRFGGLFKADLGASYRLPLADARALRFYVLVENLFDQDYYEGGFRTPGLGARAGAALSF